MEYYKSKATMFCHCAWRRCFQISFYSTIKTSKLWCGMFYCSISINYWSDFMLISLLRYSNYYNMLQIIMLALDMLCAHLVTATVSFMQFHFKPAGCALSLYSREVCSERLFKEVNRDKAFSWIFPQCVWNEWIYKQADSLIDICMPLVLALKNTLSK